MIKNLIKLANHLDKKGLHKEADYLDKVIFKYSNDESTKDEVEHMMSISESLQSHTNEPEVGQKVKNINPKCKHFGSEGTVVSINPLDEEMGTTITYQVSNSNGDTYNIGDILTKTLDQMAAR